MGFFDAINVHVSESAAAARGSVSLDPLLLGDCHSRICGFSESKMWAIAFSNKVKVGRAQSLVTTMQEVTHDERTKCFEQKQFANSLLHRRVKRCDNDVDYDCLRQQ